MGKSSRGTSLDTRRRQDAACAGIGKRRLVRLHLWKGAKKGKRRQHGGQTSDTEMGDGNAAIDEFIAHAPDIPVYNDIPYTRAQQCSPDRDNRGKRRRLLLPVALLAQHGPHSRCQPWTTQGSSCNGHASGAWGSTETTVASCRMAQNAGVLRDVARLQP